MSESKIEDKVVKKAKKLGFLTYKFSSPSNKGVPDRLFICPRGKLFFIEFKSNTGKLSKSQQFEIEKLRIAFQTVFVVNDVEVGFEVLNSYL